MPAQCRMRRGLGCARWVGPNRTCAFDEYAEVRSRASLLTLAVAVPYMAIGLWSDRYVGAGGQLALGLLTGNTTPMFGMGSNLPFIAGGGR